MTEIYIMVYLPIALAYMEKKQQTEGKINLYPIYLILFVYITTNIAGIGGSYRWQMFMFNLNKVFKWR